jgi:hypothetical protein
MNKKLILVIALIGIGLWALPQTMSLFAGQHSFVNIDAVGNQINCVKCHGDVKAELSVGLTGTQAPHANFECEFCHRVRAGEASGDNAYSQITYTAVSPTDAALTVKRSIIITERDMEARNIPAVMPATPNDGVTFAKTAVLISGKQVQEVLGFKYKTSGCYKSIAALAADPAPSEVPCDAAELALTLVVPDPRYFQASSLYGSDGVTPLDTVGTTKLGTFDASKVTFTYAGVQSTRSPYGWTWEKRVGGVLPIDKVTPNNGFNNAGSEVSNAGTLYHAASLVSCLECHGGEAPTGHHDAEYGVGTGCNACHYAGGANKGGLAGIMAGGFGLGVTAQDSGSLEVHKDFVTNNDGVLVYEARPDGTEAASNTACVACHTHVSVDIQWTKPTKLSMTVDTNVGGTTTYTVKP